MRRINGQLDDFDQQYLVEKLVTFSGFIKTFYVVTRNVSLKNAELIARRLSASGIENRVSHASDY